MSEAGVDDEQEEVTNRTWTRTMNGGSREKKRIISLTRKKPRLVHLLLLPLVVQVGEVVADLVVQVLAEVDVRSGGLDLLELLLQDLWVRRGRRGSRGSIPRHIKRGERLGED